MTHYQAIQHNKLQSWVVIGGFITFITAASSLMALGFGYGLDFVGMALIFSGMMSFASYWWSDSLILGISGARVATRKEFFDFYTVTENLCLGARLPLPKLYVIEDTAMNAFATGRDPQHAVVCATTGLLSRLERSELEGVIAHELSHVQNYDTRLMSIVSILVGFIALLADWMVRSAGWGGRRNKNDDKNQLAAVFFVVGLVLALVSPIIAQLIQLAISRKREFLADASAVGFTKNPAGLARALTKISQDQEPLEAANKATAHLYFADPLRNLRSGNSVGWFASLFHTHPPVEERIRLLKQMA